MWWVGLRRVLVRSVSAVSLQVLSAEVVGRYQVVSVVVSAVGGVGTPSGSVSVSGLGSGVGSLDRLGRLLVVSGAPFSSAGSFGLSALYAGDAVFSASSVSSSLVVGRSVLVVTLEGLVAG